MPSYIDEEAERYVRALGPEHDDLHAEMAAFADEHDFPIIGPDAGGVLRSYAAATQAERVFEFGSGFGYSAYWFLKGMADDGRIVLTEIDEAELAKGEEFLASAGLADRATFECGDAMEIAHDYAGPFDVALIDHQKSRYADAFDLIRDELAPGGVVIADNMLYGGHDFHDSLDYVTGDGDLPDDENARGIVAYLEAVRGAEGFHTSILPVGSGLAVTVRDVA
ncbi:caffeoyl-CoA O-methyltransferase [Halovivax asiaticus JCM 14624]|uniref:Caffeoyl-CoA O-methyltransferase n=1 Tax=Halovivax asiaticus JCM 14624 TaxID=1227490 RepID=M0BIT0_9EURY|nr:O-methyltransferase [Halovivax asiaticus]ELZ10806.1 caffeoyl-CoA O-methyltransferase [Halovivax asiaticus JCM 14624]